MVNSERKDDRLEIALKEISERKDDHLKIALKEKTESTVTTWLECVKFIHSALPEMNIENIDTSIEFLGKKLFAPLIISGITGGTEKGKEINKNLAQAAQKYGIGMMVGSQRIALNNPKTTGTFSIVRKYAPDIPIIANIGISQIVKSTDKNYNSFENIIKMIDADALAIHLNPLQEIIQPEGETNFEQGLKKIAELKDNLEIPILVKETGSGISREIAKELINIGIKIISVSGVGGTSWAAVESYRKKIQIQEKSNLKSDLAELFWNWGIPTAASIIETKSACSKSDNIKIIGSGGIRTGLDIAKCIAIGADLAGLAKPFLNAAAVNEPSYLNNLMEKLMNELKVTMFLTGNRTIQDLKETSVVIMPQLKFWLEERDIYFKKIKGV
ncbi:MAG: type 2 isopentenyl-diphosphate Delta-isomerase [Promethearchaeota archaeon]